MKEIYNYFKADFQRIFGVPLSQFWDGHHGGFMMAAFCTQVLEYDGPEPYKECARLYEDIGTGLIYEMLAWQSNLWFPEVAKLGKV
jgi:hypothetical protein